ncbi:MAG TPA: hypothetical protein VKD72_26100 [Gemmataceae bacterium]|nr:hypothetical protein [Gemmataceae bacterium]
MRMIVVLVLLGAAAAVAVPAARGQQPAAADWPALLSDDPQVLEQRATQLRRDGPAALERLLAARKSCNNRSSRPLPDRRPRPYKNSRSNSTA